MPETITDRLCNGRVTKQTKVYDKPCPGFYVSITPKGGAKFAFKFWDGTKQASVPIGVYHPEHLPVAVARAVAFDLKSKVARGMVVQQIKAQRPASGVTVDQIIDDYVAHVSEPVKKADGEKRPRLESWKVMASFLDREVRPAIGSMAPADVTNNEIAQIQQRVAKRSISGARQVRSAMKGLFSFGAEAGRKYGLTSSPVHNLPKIDKEQPRTVVLNESEIRTLWWGLDHPGLPVTREVALGIKFELVTMLRTKEFLNTRREFIVGRGTPTPVLRVPLKFVKKRRTIEQPLNSLAVGIVNEAMARHNNSVVFSPRLLDPDAVLNRSALSHALRGKRQKRGKKLVVDRIGICEFLGLKDFTPHDLRRTAATLCGDIGISDADIAKCLDHQKGGGTDVAQAPSVTGRVYVQSRRLDEKRKVLNALDAELRRIIGVRPKVLPCARLAA
jgi:integrase